MIQFSLELLRVLDDQERPTVLDVSQLEHELAEAFRSLGFQDVWMAELVSLTVEERIRSNSATLLRSAEIDQLIVSILQVSGYPDVALLYGKQHPHDLFAEAQRRMRLWDEPAVYSLLLRTLPMPPNQAHSMALRLLDALRLLGLSQATETFLTELALHLWENSRRSGRTKHVRNRRNWLENVSPATQDLMAKGIVGVLPVVGAFPRGTVTVNTAGVMEHLGGGFVSEFSLSGAFDALEPCLQEVLLGVHEEMIREYPEQAKAPLLLLFPAFSASLARWMSLPEDRRAFQDFLQGLVEERVIKSLKFEVSLYFR